MNSIVLSEVNLFVTLSYFETTRDADLQVLYKKVLLYWKFTKGFSSKYIAEICLKLEGFWGSVSEAFQCLACICVYIYVYLCIFACMCYGVDCETSEINVAGIRSNGKAVSMEYRTLTLQIYATSTRWWPCLVITSVVESKSTLFSEFTLTLHTWLMI